MRRLGPLAVMLLAPLGALAQATANDLLLNDDPWHPNLRPTSTVVARDRFVASAEHFTTAVTEVRFCVGLERTDVATSDTIPAPLAMERNGVQWFEHNLLVSGIGFYATGTYPYGRQQGQGRYLNLRVQYPRSDWNGKLIYWHHGVASLHTHAFTPLLEPELMLSRGWAVAIAVFSGPVPEQQNPNAPDKTFWKWIDEMYLADPGGYASYSNHPRWGASDGSPLGDASIDRNLAGLVKNLLYPETGIPTLQAFWTGWSAGGEAGIGLANGRDLAGNYTGGNFNAPYRRSSGRVFDGFMAIAPLFIPTAPVDPEFPVTAPFVFIDGSTDQLLLSFPNALNFAHKVKDALLGPMADPSLSRDINDWVRLYMQRYGNHDWTGRFYEVAYAGAGDTRIGVAPPGHPHAGAYPGKGPAGSKVDEDALYLDITEPVESRVDTDGRGRKLDWVFTEMAEHSPVYFTPWMDQDVSGWGQVSHSYYQINDGYHLQLFENLVDWVTDGAPPPRSRIDPIVYDPLLVDYPDLPRDDVSQDSLNRDRFPVAPFLADIEWQRSLPAFSLDVDLAKGMVDMPHVVARTGTFYNGYKFFEITAFTPAELTGGYHHGNVSFDGYAGNDDYLDVFVGAIDALVAERLFDPEIAARFANGDPAVPLPF